jgi:hypothetical protein
MKPPCPESDTRRKGDSQVSEMAVLSTNCDMA